MVYSHELPPIDANVIAEQTSYAEVHVNPNTGNIAGFTMFDELATPDTAKNVTLVYDPEANSQYFRGISPNLLQQLKAPHLAMLALSAVGASKEAILSAYDPAYTEMLDHLCALYGIGWNEDHQLAKVSEGYRLSILRPMSSLVLSANETDYAMLSGQREHILDSMRQRTLSTNSRALEDLREIKARHKLPTTASALALTNILSWRADTRSASDPAEGARKALLRDLRVNGIHNVVEYGGATYTFDFKGVIPPEREKYASLWLLGLSASEMRKILKNNLDASQINLIISEIRPALSALETNKSVRRSIAHCISEGYVVPNQHAPVPKVSEDLLTKSIMKLLPCAEPDGMMARSLSGLPGIGKITTDDVKACRERLCEQFEAANPSELVLKLFATGALSREYARPASFKSLSLLVHTRQ